MSSQYTNEIIQTHQFLLLKKNEINAMEVMGNAYLRKSVPVNKYSQKHKCN